MSECCCPHLSPDYAASVCVHPFHLQLSLHTTLQSRLSLVPEWFFFHASISLRCYLFCLLCSVIGLLFVHSPPRPSVLY